MLRIFLLIILLFPNISHADKGLNLTCKNLLSALGKHYEPLNFKLEVTGFHYFDKDHNEFKVIPSEELVFGDDMFVAKFPEYELGFQRMVYAGETEQIITMSKYDFINDKFLAHYECDVETTYID